MNYLLQKDIIFYKSFLNIKQRKNFCEYLINKIDDLYYLSGYISFLFIGLGGGLLEIEFIDKLIIQNKFKKIIIFIVDDYFYNLKKKILLKNFIKKKNVNINLFIFTSFSDFYEFILQKNLKLDFLIGLNKFNDKFNNDEKNYWTSFVNKLVGSYGVYDKDIYLVDKNNEEDIDIKINSLYKLTF